MKELMDKLIEDMKSKNISIVIIEHPFKHSYQTTEIFTIDSIPEFKP